jgi:hypothetical protein
MPKEISKQAEVRKLFVMLTGMFPTIHPCILKVTTKLPTDEWGDTGPCKVGGKDHLIIRISSRISREAMLLITLHEYAHAMQWRPDHQHGAVDHNAEWGVALAQIWTWYTPD